MGGSQVRVTVVTEEGVRLRAYRVCLDPTGEQRRMLAQHAGQNRAAFNHALSVKIAAHQEFVRIRHELAIAAGADTNDPAALKTFNRAAGAVAPRIPTYMTIATEWTRSRGDSRTGTEGPLPWWHTVNRYAITSGMRAADAAFNNWLDSVAGRRRGRRMGYPRYKKKGRARDSFTLFHDVKKPGIRMEDARHLRLPTIGSVRLHSNLRRLIRLQARTGAVVVQSVTVARDGDRWFAAILVKEPAPAVRPTRPQRAAGIVGIDLGVEKLLATSTGEIVPNPRTGQADAHRLALAQQAVARAQKGSNRRRKAVARVGRIKARQAERRRQVLHQVTKRLVTGWAGVAIEDLNVAGMTRSARGTIDNPGRNVRQKAGLNREILDVSFGELRRQLEYKSDMYGSRVAVVDRFYPSSKTCSHCSARHPSLTLSIRTYRCSNCGLTIDRDTNAALNLARQAVASTLNPSAPTTAHPAPATTTLSGQAAAEARPDTCDTRDPEATTYRDAREELTAGMPAQHPLPGRPTQTGGHPGRVTGQRSPRAHPT